MKRAYEMVAEFHRVMGAPVGDVRAPDVSTRQELRLALIGEELRELAEALEQNDAIGAADALADLAYVVIGAAVEWGIPLAEVFAEVHRSNMTKVGGHKRADGKILKPPHYSPPCIGEVMRLVAARAIGEQAVGMDASTPAALAPERVVYLAHPVAPPCTCGRSHKSWGSAAPQRAVRCNCVRALRWLDWAVAAHPEVAFVASWLPYIDVLPEDDGPNRERGLRDNVATAVRCDEIWLVGGRISRGMARERDAMVAAGRRVVDMTALGHEPPELG